MPARPRIHSKSRSCPANFARTSLKRWIREGLVGPTIWTAEPSRDRRRWWPTGFDKAQPPSAVAVVAPQARCDLFCLSVPGLLPTNPAGRRVHVHGPPPQHTGPQIIPSLHMLVYHHPPHPAPARASFSTFNSKFNSAMIRARLSRSFSGVCYFSFYFFWYTLIKRENIIA